MPFYQDIQTNTSEGIRTVDRLLKLREQLKREIPQKDLESNLLLATWNIREFGTPKYGGRRPEALYYIAEIISKFNLVAVQEVRKDLKALKELMKILGSNWEYIVTDVTEGKQGNEERLAFVFDSRKVKFGGLAGEMVLPPMETKDPDTKQTIYTPSKQLVRTPFMCGFKAGWTDFVLTTVHILYGESAADDPNRIEEIRNLATAMASKAKGQYEWSPNLVLLGDFNIFSKTDQTMTAITDAGFIVPQEIQALPGSNAPKNKFYDQIAFMVRENRFETTGKAGVLDFFETVYRKQDEALYESVMGDDYHTDSKGNPRKDKTGYYKTYYRTFQMSDHLPMWVEIKIDHTDAYLRYRAVPPQEDDQVVDAPAKNAAGGKTSKKPS
ncbi:Endonuclease/Exonuclease/phosphatase family protein [Dyadobacter soli]|uniref:Endonuclease/Exonuclease/phosphatase family protein n=1 Tax=Dyadobacter soli TaxID=659014 RepID=A0A1G7MNX6_9BACT|nr:endonuclease/exonuclease/phosphatase family protein [Dyadobacter soli]SDF62819.1 Endonuclease/Exonuclease/phosphatase family protein [Dyadobacter soli]